MNTYIYIEPQSQITIKVEAEDFYAADTAFAKVMLDAYNMGINLPDQDSFMIDSVY